jgi:O-antigen ligase
VKWPALIIALAIIGPLANWLRRNPRHVPMIWIIMGLLPFVLDERHLYLALVSWAGWPGYVMGVELSVLDLLAVAIYLSLPRTGPSPPFWISMALYFLAAVLAAFQAESPLFALGYSWQLARMFLVYAVVSKAAATDERVVPALLTGLAIGLCYEAGVTLWQRFGRGVLQATGTVGHQNLLGLMSHFVVFPWFALLLAGQRGWQPVAAPLAGVVTAVMTVSRATLGLGAAGYAGLFMLSAARRWTSRKALFLAAGATLVAILVPVVLSSIERRFDGQLEGTADAYDERAAFERAATMIISDHPWGVGTNHYVVAANTGGYNTRARVAAVQGSDSAHVHNAYLLVAAESGYLGIVTFVLMLLQPMVVAFRCGWRHRGDRRGDVLLGFGISLLVVYLHNNFEWAFVAHPVQYMFALDVGMVAGLAQQFGYWRRSVSGIRIEAGQAFAPMTKPARN